MNVYDVLEICLNEIEHGADMDTVIFRYPEFADKLRPILETSVKAKAMAVPVPSQEVVRRNRAKLLQHAAEMREAKAAPISHRVWSVPLRRALVSLMVVAVLFMSSTGLVRASSNTLPGDNLYPVKRTWEDMLVFFTFNADERQALELEHENERLEELHELFAEGRSAEVDFAGYVTRQSGTEWRVSGITIFISSETQLPDPQVDVGAAVRVHGRVQSGGVAAMQVELLPPDSKLPEAQDDELEIEEENVEDVESEADEKPGTGSIVEPTALPTVIPTLKTPAPTVTVNPEDVTVDGTVTSIQNNLIVINGIVMDIQFAEEIKGTPSVGAIAKVEGYYDASGVFIVTKIEFKITSSGSSVNNNDNGDDDNTTNDDDSNDDNDNDSGDNSGSGGGDD